jgi:hypothetical protein
MEVNQQLQINRFDLFRNLCDAAYDQINEETFSTMTGKLKELTSAQGVINLFKDGFTFCMVPDFMDCIDRFIKNKMPFIIIVTDKAYNGEEYIFAVVNGQDVVY